MFFQTFLSSQVKRCVIITYKHGIYELPHELLNNLSLITLANQDISGKCLDVIESYPSAQSPWQQLNFVCLLKGASSVNLHATNLVPLYFATIKLPHTNHAKLAHANHVKLAHANHVKTKNQLTINCNSLSPQNVINQSKEITQPEKRTFFIIHC